MLKLLLVVGVVFGASLAVAVYARRLIVTFLPPLLVAGIFVPFAVGETQREGDTNSGVVVLTSVFFILLSLSGVVIGRRIRLRLHPDELGEGRPRPPMAPPPLL